MDILVSHPAVAEVAVVGKLDPARGEIPLALVVRNSLRLPKRTWTGGHPPGGDPPKGVLRAFFG